MKKAKWFVLIIIISLIITYGISYSFRVTFKEYNDDNFSVKYDSTWKVEDDVDQLKLQHKKTDSVVRIQTKVLSSIYNDVSLDNIINDIMNSIESQNVNYKLINRMDNPTEEYESYSYLYERGMIQVMVNVYKKDNKLVIVYYESNSEYFDIVLDSVDTLLSTLKIYTGERVN